MTSRSVRRTLFACLMLALNLFGSGVPLLHAAAHVEDEHPHAHTASTEHAEVRVADHIEIEHPPQDHPSSLHEDCVYTQRINTAFALPAVSASIDLLLLRTGVVLVPASTTGWSPRAPPPGDPARAPPHV